MIKATNRYAAVLTLSTNHPIVIKAAASTRAAAMLRFRLALWTDAKHRPSSLRIRRRHANTTDCNNVWSPSEGVIIIQPLANVDDNFEGPRESQNAKARTLI